MHTNLNLNVKNANRKIENTPAFPQQDCLFLKRKDVYEKVKYSDILYIEAHGSSLTVVTKLNRQYVLSINLKNFIRQVSDVSLQRVHRSFIVNIAQVEAIKGRQLVVGQRDIPFNEDFKNKLGLFFPMLSTVVN